MTVAQLGNVYRNSKWSDLKISNIKPSFYFQFFKNFMVLFISFIVIYTLITWGLGLFSIETYPLSKLWFYFADTIQYAILILLRCIYLGFEKIITMYSNLLHKSFFKAHTTTQVISVRSPSGELPAELNNKLLNLEHRNWTPSTINNQKLPKLYKELQINLSKNPIIDEDKLLYIWSCQKCVLCLQQVDQYIDFNSFDHSNKFIRNIDLLEAKIGPLSPQTITRILYIETMNSVKPEPNQVFFLKDRTHKYSNFYSLRKFGFDPSIAYSTKTYPLDFNKLKFLHFSIKKILVNNIERNIAITKQGKWAWRSSILSDNFILKNLSLTNTKKLISTSSFSNSSLKKQIWIANKINDNKNFLKLNNLLLQSTTVSGLSHKNVYSNLKYNALNFSENSILWLAKRFFLTQNMSLGYLTYNTTASAVSWEKNKDFSKKLKSLETLGANNLILLFNIFLNTNFVKQDNIFSYYDVSINTAPTTFRGNTSQATNFKYLLEFADQITFSTTFLIRFASHFSNTLVFDKNSLVLFSNILYSNQDINIKF
jgi:hypothetical protein